MPKKHEELGKMKEGVVYAIANLIAVFVFPFWLMWQNFAEWRKERRTTHD